MTALLKFSQGATVGADGRALVVASSVTPVTIENSDNTNVGSYLIELLYAPPDNPTYSTVVPGVTLPLVLASGDGIPSANLNVNGGYVGTYRVRLTTWPGAGQSGTPDVDIRCVSVPTPNQKIILPPYQKFPDPLPLSGLGSKPDELNFDGQTWGWAGSNETVSFRLVNEALRMLDLPSGSGAVSSVFGRTGAVVAQANDYGSDEVTNDSSVNGLTVSAALDALAVVDNGGVLISPSQITADQNDYNPTGFSTAQIVRLTSDASRTITGLSGSATVVQKILFNVGSNDIVFAHQSASSSAANRIDVTGDSDLTLESGDGALLAYDATSARWRVVASGALGGGGLSAPVPYTSLLETGPTLEINEPAGFPLSGSDSPTTLTFDDGTRTLTIAPTGANFSVWVGGGRQVKTSESVTWTNVEGKHYFFFDAAGVLTHSTNTADFIAAIRGSGATVAALYWDADNNTSIRRLDERHGLMDGATHARLHLGGGAAYINGGEPLDLVFNTNDAGGGVGISETRIVDEDIYHTAASRPKPGSFPVFFLIGPEASPTVRRKPADPIPMLQPGSVPQWGVGQPKGAFNLLSGGTWSLDDSNQSDIHIIMTMCMDGDLDEPLFFLLGADFYSSAFAARQAAPTELQRAFALRGLFSEEVVPLWSIIIRTADWMPGNKIQLVTADNADFVDWRGTTQGGVGFSASTASDIRVRVSGNDTTSGFLLEKLVAGTGITITENNDGANETVTVSSSGSSDLASVLSAGSSTGGTNITVSSGDSIDFGGEVSISRQNVSVLTSTGSEVVLNLATSSQAASGSIRATNNTTIVAARNSADDADLIVLSTNASDEVVLGDPSAPGISITGTEIQHEMYTFLANDVPSGNPVGGGYLYSEAGALTWRGSSGTITVMAPA